MNTNETHARIGEYIRSHASETYSQIAASLGLSRGSVVRIARLNGIKRQPGKRPSALEAAVAAIEAGNPTPECNPADEAVPPLEQTVSAAPDEPTVDTTVA